MIDQTVSIMPLVEENRKLHAEVLFLRRALEEQNVRLDQFLENRPKMVTVDVSVSPLSRITMSPYEGQRALAADLGSALIERVPKLAQKIMSDPYGGVILRFFVLEGGK